jgi:hypothetical protein
LNEGLRRYGRRHGKQDEAEGDRDAFHTVASPDGRRKKQAK